MIDYQNIADSIEFYSQYGFKRIESPWTVTEAASNITKPPGCKDFKLKHEDNKVLVASGEQSFLYLYLKDFLPKGEFQTVTPCFRHESFDELHKKYFIKNELIDTDFSKEKPIDKLQDMVVHAQRFFQKCLGSGEIRVDRTEEFAYDLVHARTNIELGSYGIRECGFLKWVYGTGCAEPRLSYVISLTRN